MSLSKFSDSLFKLTFLKCFQENKFKEATGFYEPIVKKNFDSILNVSAIVLANLCVSYIMTSQNEEAEAGGISCRNRRFEQKKVLKLRNLANWSSA